VKVSTQRLPESQVLLEIEVDPVQMERSLDKAYRRLVQQVEVPGFRKGKTPRNMLERHLGRDRIVSEAIDILIPEAYNKAIDEHEIDAIGQPRVELVSAEPLSFKATVPIRPTVELGDYKALSVERPAVEPDEADVAQAIEELRQRYAVQQPAERPVKTGDIIRADIKIVIDDQEIYSDEDAEVRLREGATILLPGFAEGVVGMKKGETKEVEVTTPEGERPLSGKTGKATVTIREVKEEVLPEANDAFANEVGEGFASLAALQERLRSDLQERLMSHAEEKLRDEVVKALTDSAMKIEFPPVLIDREIQREIEDQARSAGQTVEAYLELIKKTPEEIREALAPAATERVRRSLALSEFAETEGIEVQASEVDAEIEKIAESAGEHADRMRQIFSTQEARASIERSLLTRNTVDRLVSIVSPDGADGGEATEPASKPKTRKKSESKRDVAPAAASKEDS
jgi:trigger factor